MDRLAWDDSTEDYFGKVQKLREALRKIRDGLADTGSTPGKRMTLITKADAYEIASAAILDE